LQYVDHDAADVHFVGISPNVKDYNLTIVILSCRGLKVLVDLLDEDYTEQEELVVHALNGISNVFELQSPTTKNDFCRMFIREGLLDPLSLALLNVMGIRGESTLETKMKIIQTLLVFCQVSQSDVHVRNALGTRQVIRRELFYYQPGGKVTKLLCCHRSATRM
jgi:hypothetical protein